MPSTPTIPDHTLLRPIGRGAYGEVWLARNVMGTPRAVKIIWRRQFTSDRPYEREFAGIQRFEPVSRSADGLVHVLHVGRNDAEGYFYYVMELADSAVPLSEGPLKPRASNRGSPTDDSLLSSYTPRTLRSDLKQLGRLPVADCLRVALDVTGGLARLHDRGLVHRDVKPGNIIFVDGRAKLADVGLISTESEGRTFVGTEGYIPPEGPGTPGADLYALGMVLYEGITGYPPDEFPKVPPDWFIEESAPEPLEFHEVVLKACEGAKGRRYQSAEMMHADVALLQSGQSLRHLRALEIWASRWRRLGWGAAVGVVLAVGISLAAGWRAKIAAEGRMKEARLREQAQRSLQRAESAERDSRQQLYTSLLEQARATLRSGELGQRVRALDAVRRAAAISNSVDLRGEVFAALALPDLRFERLLPYGTEFTMKELDPAFERIAVCRGRGPVEIRAVSDNRLLATLPASTNAMTYGALWSADGRFLSVRRDLDSAGMGGILEIWEVASARQVLLVRDLSWSSWSFHPHKPQLLTGGASGSVVAWNLENGHELARAQFAGPAHHLLYSPDGNRVAAGYGRDDGWHISIHSAMDGALLVSHVFSNQVSSLVWHPGGRSLAASDYSGAVHWMDAQTGETKLLGQHKADAVTTAFSPDGAYLMSGGWERELICWDVTGLRRAFTIGLDSYVMRFCSDGRQCTVLTPYGVQLHTLERPVAHREFAEDLGGRLRRAAFSPDGRWLAATGEKNLGVWDLVAKGSAALTSEGLNAHCDFSADSRELLGCANKEGKNECLRWNVVRAAHPSDPPLLKRLPIATPDGFNFLTSHSNSVVLTGSKGSQVLGCQMLETGSETWIPTAAGIAGMSPDGRWLGIYRSFGTSLYIYQLPGLERITKLPHPASIGDFRFSPLGDELAVASRSRLEFWSTRTWQKTRTLTNFSRILYSPDAQTVWLNKDLRTAGLYEARTFKPLLMLPTGMLPLALSPDGNQVVVTVDTRRLQLWDLKALRAEMGKLALNW